MPEQAVLKLADLPVNTKKTVTLGETKILIVRTDDRATGEPTLFAVEAECPHAKAPLEKGAVCNGRLVCPWHTGTFVLETGKLVEPPPLRDLQRYPVRLAGEDILVDPTPIPAVQPAPVGQDRHMVFAGAGAATAAALAYLRDAGFAGRVTVVDPELDEPVDRTQLTKNALAGKKPLDTLPIFSPQGQEHTPGTLDQALAPMQVKRLKAHITGLDLDQSTVTIAETAPESFDALLLATGGQPQRANVPGADLPHVFTLRHTADLKAMEPLLQPGKHAVLIGDSFIAFEAASALKQRGLEPTVIAQSELPFAGKFGPEIAHALTGWHRSHGTTLLPSTEVLAIEPGFVRVKDVSGADLGDKIAGDVVIFAIGVEPILDYAPGLARAEKGGLALGRNLRVARQVWAAGDIAAVDGTRIEHWRLAQQHGRTAAEAMFAYATGNAHGPAYPFAGVPLFWTFHYDKRLNYAGHADAWDAMELEGDPLGMDFLAYYLKDGNVAAVLGCGRDPAIAALMEPLREPLPLARAQALVAAASQG